MKQVRSEWKPTIDVYKQVDPTLLNDEEKENIDVANKEVEGDF